MAAGARPDRLNTKLALSPLHVAAARGEAKVLGLLVLAAGRDGLQPRDRAGQTPLHNALQAGHIECAGLLVRAGAALDCQDSRGGHTPLLVAATGPHRSWEAVELLCGAGAVCGPEEREALLAAGFSSEQLAGLGITAGQRNGSTARSELQRLLDLAQLDGETVPAWQKAVAAAQDLNTAHGRLTPLQSCAERGLAGYAAVLLTAGADPNVASPAQSSVPLLLAATAGQAGVLAVLLEGGAGCRARDQDGQTALHCVLRRGREGAVRGAGPGPDYPACLQLLLARPAPAWAGSINSQDSLGNTALHYAVQLWDQDTVTKLLLLGANIGLRNRQGEAAISHILPDTLERYLDTHCLQAKGTTQN